MAVRRGAEETRSCGYDWIVGAFANLWHEVISMIDPTIAALVTAWHAVGGPHAQPRASQFLYCGRRGSGAVGKRISGTPPTVRVSTTMRPSAKKSALRGEVWRQAKPMLRCG